MAIFRNTKAYQLRTCQSLGTKEILFHPAFDGASNFDDCYCDCDSDDAAAAAVVMAFSINVGVRFPWYHRCARRKNPTWTRTWIWENPPRHRWRWPFRHWKTNGQSVVVFAFPMLSWHDNNSQCRGHRQNRSVFEFLGELLGRKMVRKKVGQIKRKKHSANNIVEQTRPKLSTWSRTMKLRPHTAMITSIRERPLDLYVIVGCFLFYFPVWKNQSLEFDFQCFYCCCCCCCCR